MQNLSRFFPGPCEPYPALRVHYGPGGGERRGKEHHHPADSGYAAKRLNAACQTEILDDKGSDCGSKNYIPVLMTKSLTKSFVFRYIMENGKPKLLTYENELVQLNKERESLEMNEIFKTAKEYNLSYQQVIEMISKVHVKN